MHRRLIGTLRGADKDLKRALVTVQKLIEIIRTPELEKAEGLLMAQIYNHQLMKQNKFEPKDKEAQEGFTWLAKHWYAHNLW